MMIYAGGKPNQCIKCLSSHPVMDLQKTLSTPHRIWVPQPYQSLWTMMDFLLYQVAHRAWLQYLRLKTQLRMPGPPPYHHVGTAYQLMDQGRGCVDAVVTHLGLIGSFVQW